MHAFALPKYLDVRALRRGRLGETRKPDDWRGDRPAVYQPNNQFVVGACRRECESPQFNC